MASQIYSRWVPPAKTKPPTTPQKLEVISDPATAVSYTPPTTRPDASATYARYVPPSKSKHTQAVEPIPTIPADVFATSPSPQKRKREEGETREGRSSPKKPRKEKKQQIASEVESLKVGDDTADKIKKSGKVASHDVELNEPLVDENENSMVDPDAIETEASTKKEKKKRRQQEQQPIDMDEEMRSRDTQKEESTMDLDDEESEAKVKDKKSKPKKKNREHSEAEKKSGSGVEDEESDKKHQRLMKKRQKSLKKTEALAQVEDSPAEDVVPEEAQELHDLVPLPQPEPAAELPAISATEALPPWMASPIRVSPTDTARFEDLGLGGQVSNALEKAGYKEAFAVQSAVLPLLLPAYESGDILVSAATGSGKTLAYVLPTISKLSQFSTTELRGLIVMPTRELVMQAKAVADICSTAFHTDHKRVVIGTAVGNETLKAEQSKLMHQTSVYDPAKYRALIKSENRKWDEASSDLEFHALFEQDTLSSLPDHVVEFTSNVDVLICTPGRLVEHLKSTPGFTLRHVSMLVVDEADKLLDQSFQQWVQVILTALGPRPPHHEVTKVILSATMTRDIGQLSQLKLYRPRFVELEGTSHTESKDTAHVLPQDLIEFGVKIEDESIKPLYLLEVLRRQNIIARASSVDSESSDSSDSSDEDSDDDSSTTSSTMPEIVEESTSDIPRGVLIFTKSNENAVRLSRLIALLVPSSAPHIGTLTSTLPRASRERTIRSFSNGSVSVLVASDLVSRGLDLPNLAHVINYDIPSSLTSYVHRVGRTARAGKAGHAWTFFTETDGRWFWNEIARVGSVKREKKVGRENIYKDKFTEDERKLYQDALEELGNEAGNARKD